MAAAWIDAPPTTAGANTLAVRRQIRTDVLSIRAYHVIGTHEDAAQRGLHRRRRGEIDGAHLVANIAERRRNLRGEGQSLR